MAAPALHFARVPEGMGFAEAAALPLAALTAWQSLEAAGVEAGQTVLVHGGAGGVGHLAIQIARAWGAEVVATASAEHRDWLRGLGAAEVLPRDGLAAARGMDVVVDLVGGAATGAALDCARAGGVLLAVADGAADEAAAAAARRGVRVLEPLVEPDGRALDALGELVAAARLRVAVHSVLPLAEAAHAHELLERGGLRGKLVLEVT